MKKAVVESVTLWRGVSVVSANRLYATARLRIAILMVGPRIATLAVVALLATMVPASAYHIDEADGDIALSSLMTEISQTGIGGAVVVSNGAWWLGTMLVVPTEAVEDIAGDDGALEGASEACLDSLAGGNCETVWWIDDYDLDLTDGDGDACSFAVEGILVEREEFNLCETPIVGEMLFDEGLVACERNSVNALVSDATAGYGGRCFSAAAERPWDYGDNLGENQYWTRMSVDPAEYPSGWGVGDEACDNGWDDGAGYYASVGSDAFGVHVVPGEDFAYRDAFAHWATDGHIRISMALDHRDTSLLYDHPNSLACFGYVEHSDAGTAIAELDYPATGLPNCDDDNGEAASVACAISDD
ncbi:MAG: hypothetical protein HYT80_08950 [Euryarchaeota archaeon]|nr:hypothetical protein [Euryarchaeota archaeon]